MSVSRTVSELFCVK